MGTFYVVVENKRLLNLQTPELSNNFFRGGETRQVFQ